VFAPRSSSLKRVFYTLLLLFTFDILSVPFAALICNPPVTADRDGHKPEDIARAFISAVDADDYETAASFFTKQSVNEIQHNSAYEYSFPHYCSRFKGLDSVEFDRSWRGKGNYWRLGMSGKRNGEPAGYSFYFDRVGNKWLMTVSEMSYFWGQAEATEPHANLIITNYRLGSDRNDYPPRAKAGDKTVLVHRIGHDRAIPAYRPLAEGDGAFRCRLRLGTYVIEYEEITGQLKDQRITYSTATHVFEAGRSYKLSGYTTTTLDGDLEQPASTP
jgi:hypothetical protein